MTSKRVVRRGLVGALAATGLLAAGCSSSSHATSTATTASSGSSASTATTTATPSSPAIRHLNIAFANITSANPSLKALAGLIADSGKTSGDTVTVYDNAGDPQTAISNASLMVNAHPDVILDWPPAPGLGNSMQAVFNRANIPCIAVNIQIGTCPWFELDNSTLGFQTGQAVAAIMKQKGWDGSNTVFVIAQNSKVGDQNNDLERNGYLAVAQALPGFKTEPLTSITANTTTIGTSAVQVDTGDSIDTAYTAMKNALQTIPAGKNVVVYGITDESTLGASRALTDAGRTSALLVGNGGDATGLSQLRTNPQWVAESDSFVPQWGEFLMAMAHAVTTKGVKVPAATMVPTLVLTKSNLAQYYPGTSDSPTQLPPLPAADQYLAATGILQKYGNIPGLSS